MEEQGLDKDVVFYNKYIYLMDGKERTDIEAKRYKSQVIVKQVDISGLMDYQDIDRHDKYLNCQ